MTTKRAEREFSRRVAEHAESRAYGGKVFASHGWSAEAETIQPTPFRGYGGQADANCTN